MEVVSDIKGKIKRLSTLRLSEKDRKLLEEEDMKHEKEMKARTLRFKYVEMNIPRKYREATFGNYDDGEAPGRSKRIQDAVDCGFGLTLIGEPGRGKTHLAVAALKFMMNRYDGALPRFMPVTELFVELADRIKNDYTKESILSSYTNAPLLVLDDLGTEKRTDNALETFYLIIDRRYRNQKTTIITTNLSWAQIEHTYDKRLASRLAEVTKVLQIDGKDYRFRK